ncbi:MAG: thioredoxin [Elusimicrobia bacterium]|jgi:thioredoxin 1|nr:thioredoxin [Elusimicrobiota bacterium]
MIEVTDSNFKEEVLESDIPVLVDFWAEWCGPCKMVAPTVSDIADENEGSLKVCKLNVDNAKQTASKYGIMSIPTLAIFKDGEVADKVVGALPKDAIMAKVKPFLG